MNSQSTIDMEYTWTSYRIENPLRLTPDRSVCGIACVYKMNIENIAIHLAQKRMGGQGDCPGGHWRRDDWGSHPGDCFSVSD